ncbi:hypothetical protein CMUS01_07716 [Colletotrichum musicola]|uniref:Uncharacterized protein n=1 Tax=Colletotrichum musicola TaxID=2175873 RepID=A0A8H6NEJ3_9PEZI|nr:hypothetical protein CMUS01_07716 [Colletotrichum musicola]
MRPKTLRAIRSGLERRKTRRGFDLSGSGATGSPRRGSEGTLSKTWRAPDLLGACSSGDILPSAEAKERDGQFATGSRRGGFVGGEKKNPRKRAAGAGRRQDAGLRGSVSLWVTQSSWRGFRSTAKSGKGMAKAVARSCWGLVPRNRRRQTDAETADVDGSSEAGGDHENAEATGSNRDAAREEQEVREGKAREDEVRRGGRDGRRGEKGGRDGTLERKQLELGGVGERGTRKVVGRERSTAQRAVRCRRRRRKARVW